MDTPGTRPPVSLWFLRRLLGWNVLVWGCALPLMFANWAKDETGGRLGMVCGVVAWTIAAVVYDERLRRRGLVGASRTLWSGAAALLVLQALASAVLPSFYVFFVYLPALWVAILLRLIPDNASMFRGDFVLTILCGGQAFACAWGLGYLVERLRLRVRLWRASRRRG